MEDCNFCNKMIHNTKHSLYLLFIFLPDKFPRILFGNYPKIKHLAKSHLDGSSYAILVILYPLWSIFPSRFNYRKPVLQFVPSFHMASSAGMWDHCNKASISTWFFFDHSVIGDHYTFSEPHMLSVSFKKLLIMVFYGLIYFFKQEDFNIKWIFDSCCRSNLYVTRLFLI